MVTIAPGVWCDPCIAPIVRALHESDLPTVPSRHNPEGIRTVASCCGHGRFPGRIDLADGRVLLIVDREQADELWSETPGGSK